MSDLLNQTPEEEVRKLTSGQVEKRLGKTRETINVWAREGKLIPAEVIYNDDGSVRQRLYSEAEVERVRIQYKLEPAHN